MTHLHVGACATIIRRPLQLSTASHKVFSHSSAALYAGGGGGELCLLEVLETPAVMRCVLLCILKFNVLYADGTRFRTLTHSLSGQLTDSHASLRIKWINQISSPYQT